MLCKHSQLLDMPDVAGVNADHDPRGYLPRTAGAAHPMSGNIDANNNSIRALRMNLKGSITVSTILQGATYAYYYDALLSGPTAGYMNSDDEVRYMLRIPVLTVAPAAPVAGTAYYFLNGATWELRIYCGTTASWYKLVAT